MWFFVVVRGYFTVVKLGPGNAVVPGVRRMPGSILRFLQLRDFSTNLNTLPITHYQLFHPPFPVFLPFFSSFSFSFSFVMLPLLRILTRSSSGKCS
jgi:hypothetical protein